MSAFLSIDFDFFPYLGLYDQVECLNRKGEKTERPGIAFFDWGQRETSGGGAGFFGEALWHHRAAGCLAGGMDLQREFNIRPEKGSTPVADFVAELDWHFERPERLYVSDSHVHALDVLLKRHERHGVDHIVHFDAHHDLAYSAGEAKHIVEKQEASCSGWLFAALEFDLTKWVTIVYPDWLSYNEWFDDFPGHAPWCEKHADRIEVFTWSEWLADDHERTTAVGQFACRSSSWVPPYLDPAWDELCQDLSDNIETVSEIAQRSWDSESVARLAEQQAQMLARLTKR